MSRPIFDIGAAIRADQSRFDAFQRDRADLARRLAEAPRVERRAVVIGSSPEALVEEIEALKLKRIVPLAILVGRREWKEFLRLDGARRHYQRWFGTEETFAGVSLIVLRGAGEIRVFSDLQELGDALHELPQPLRPPKRRR